MTDEYPIAPAGGSPFRKYAIFILVELAVLLLGGLGFVYSGLYNVAADDPHWPITFRVMEIVRTRSIAAHAANIQVPKLDDPALILKGAGQYAAMCTGCHLSPAKKDSEIRPGLYPLPPNLSKTKVDPREAFWVIKHGMKMSGMPAWGKNHDDATIWSMVAFLQKLPDLSAQQYKDLVAKAPPDEDMGNEGGHAEGDDMKGMPDMPSAATGGHHHTH